MNDYIYIHMGEMQTLSREEVERMLDPTDENTIIDDEISFLSPLEKDIVDLMATRKAILIKGSVVAPAPKEVVTKYYVD